MTRAQSGLTSAIVIVAAVVVAAVLFTRAPDVATPSPSPTPASPTPIATATITPGASPTTPPSATTSPSAPAQGVYMSKLLGFALTLPPPWRKASCGNTDPGMAGPYVGELFTSAGVMEEHHGHAGASIDSVLVSANPNPDGLSPIDFARRSHPNDPIGSVTFAGRPAAEVRDSSFGGGGLIYYLAEGDRIYRVGYQPMTSGAPDTATLQRILRSFRFLSDAERRSLPDPTPVPAAAPTAEALAAMLKAAFERKDISGLERLLGPCVSQGVVPGGGAAEPKERFVAELRQQLAAGVTVTVDASAVQPDSGGPPGDAYVWSRWNAFPPGGGAPPESPQPRTFDVRLILSKAQSGFYWSGTLLVHR